MSNRRQVGATDEEPQNETDRGVRNLCYHIIRRAWLDAHGSTSVTGNNHDRVTAIEFFRGEGKEQPFCFEWCLEVLYGEAYKRLAQKMRTTMEQNLERENYQRPAYFFTEKSKRSLTPGQKALLADSEQREQKANDETPRAGTPEERAAIYNLNRSTL